MRALAREAGRSELVKNIADELLENNSRLGTIRRMFWAIQRAFQFRDETVEMIRDPRLMVEDWTVRGYLEGDCDDISTFIAALLYSLAIPARFVAIRTDPSDENYKHVFVEASDGEQWIRMDATVSVETEMQYFGERMELTI